MRLGVIGINHKLADLKLRELLAQACQRRFSPGARLHGDEHHFVLLSTCNRTEVYFSSQELSATHTYLVEVLRCDVDQDFDQKLYTFFGRDCFRHLARVASGLDSAIIAETEIQGQVRAAYETTLTSHALPPELHFLFQKALKIGKQVRSDLPLGRGIPDLEHAVFQVGTDFFQQPHAARVLFVGASEINLKILRYLRGKGFERLELCNRTLSKAKAVADKQSVKVLPWEQLNQWPTYDWIVCGTKAPHPILTLQQLPDRLVGRKLLLDLSVPRNIAPQLSLHPLLSVFNIDQLNSGLQQRRRQLADQLLCAESLVDEASARQTALFQQRHVERQRRQAI